MSSNVLYVRVPSALKVQVERLAGARRQSVNVWVQRAVEAAALEQSKNERALRQLAEVLADIQKQGAAK